MTEREKLRASERQGVGSEMAELLAKHFGNNEYAMELVEQWESAQPAPVAAERQGGDERLAVLKGCSGSPTDTALRDASGLGLDIGQTVRVLGCSDAGHVSVLELNSRHPECPWEVLAADLEYTPSQPAPSADAAMARWAVEVLDLWADAVRDEQRGNFTYQIDGKYFCAVKSGGYGHCGQYRGPTPDAARISAAKALREANPELPAPPIQKDSK